MKNTVQNQKQALINHIESLKKSGITEFQNVTIVSSDIRLGKKFALQINDSTITDFLPYAELNQFLRGYFFKFENRFDRYK